MSGRKIASTALGVWLAGCASGPRATRCDDAPNAASRPDDAPVVMLAEGMGPTRLAAEVDARRALARELSRVVGPGWADWWSYVGAMRREGYPTAVATDLLNLDRFEAAGDEVGVRVWPLPDRDGMHRARATLDGDRLLSAYRQEMARADEAMARLEAERGLWSEESWAGIERLIEDIRAGRERLERARERAAAWFGTP